MSSPYVIELQHHLSDLEQINAVQCCVETLPPTDEMHMHDIQMANTIQPGSTTSQAHRPDDELMECVVLTPEWQTLSPAPPYHLQPPIRVCSEHQPQILDVQTEYDTHHKSRLKGGQDDAFGDSFDDPEIRSAFIQKVYAILATQLLFTTAVICVFIFVLPVKNFVRRYFLIAWLAFVVQMVLYFVLLCCEGVRRAVPCNFIVLSIFTVAMSYVVGAISAHYDTEIVLYTFAITACVCVLVSLIAIFSCADITGCGAVLCILGLCVMVFGLFTLILGIFLHVRLLYLIYSGLVALLMCAYLMYDTQLIIGGRSIELSPEEYILGAICLYTDIVQMFMALLNIMSCCCSGK